MINQGWTNEQRWIDMTSYPSPPKWSVSKLLYHIQNKVSSYLDYHQNAETFPGDLRDVLWQRSPSAEIWIRRRTNFARTIGVGSELVLHRIIRIVY